jgi:hypothetical protein
VRFEVEGVSQMTGTKPRKIKLIALVLGTFFLTTVFSAEAQQQAKVPKIGLLRARLTTSGTSLDALVRESAMSRART